MKNSSKLRSISVTLDKDHKYTINSQEKITDLLKKLKNKNAISEKTCIKLRPVSSKPGTIYGSFKVDKPLKIDYHHSDPFF